MRRFSYFLMMLFLLTLTPGCGGDREKSINSPNKRKDLPRAAPPEKAK